MYLLFFKYSCLHFTPLLPPPYPSSPPTLDPNPLGFVHVSFIHLYIYLIKILEACKY